MAWLQTLAINGMLGLGAYWTARHGVRAPAGLPRTLAAIVLAWTWSTVGLIVLGSVGAMWVGPVALWALAGLMIGVVARRSDRSNAPETAPVAPDWDWTATIALGLVLWAAVLFGVTSLLLPVKVVSDGPIYHLYFAARWWKAGRLFLVAAPFGENAAPYFPAVGDLWFTWLLIGWGGDRLAKVGQAPFLLVAALAVFGTARRLGAGRSAALVATAWFVTSAPLLLFSFEPNVDTIFVAGYLVSVYFFLRAGLGDDHGASLALGALAAGGAWGTKAVGVVFVPVLLLLTALLVALRPGPIGQKVRALAALGGLPLVLAGYWMGRNVWLTGNPLYPLQLAAGGRTWLAGWYGPEAMQFSPYYLPVHSWRALGDTLLAIFDPRLAPVWLAALAGAWAWRRTDRLPRRWVWGCAALAFLNVALYWLMVPYRTQQRFALHAVGLAAVPLALLLDRSRWLRAAAVALLAVHLLTAQGWPFSGPGREPPWDLSPVIPNAVPSLIPVPLLAVGSRPEARGQLAGSIGLGLAAFATAWVWSRVARAKGGRRWVRAALGSAALPGLAIGLMLPGGADPRRSFYPLFPDYLVGWLELDLRIGPAGARVAYAGTDLPYYLLGPGLRNDVRYVNIDAHHDWLLHDYHRDAIRRGAPTWPDPRPGWDRIHPDYDAWRANLQADRIQVVVVARANPAEGPHNVADPDGFPIERQWAETHPESFEPLYGVAERDPRFRAYRVRTQTTEGGPDGRDGRQAGRSTR